MDAIRLQTEFANLYQSRYSQGKTVLYFILLDINYIVHVNNMPMSVEHNFKRPLERSVPVELET